MFLVKAMADRRTRRQSFPPPRLEWMGASEAQPNHSDKQESLSHKCSERLRVILVGVVK